MNDPAPPVRIHKPSVRLVISIPAIFALVVVIGGVLIQSHLRGIAETPGQGPARLGEGLVFAADIMIYFTAFVALLSAFVGLLLALQIVRPLRDIERQITRLGRGEQPLPTTLQPPGELGAIGSSFSQLVAQLERTIEERDRQISQTGAKVRMLLDDGGRILGVEGSVRRLLGASGEELIGLNITDPPSRTDGAAALLPIATTAADLFDSALSGVSRERQIRVRVAGEELLVAVALSSFEECDSSAKWLLEIRDVTGIATLHEQMQRADRLAAIGTLATGIAHEIRNPLASIKGMVQLLELRKEGTGSDEYYQRITAEIARLEQLISSIMDFAQGNEAPAQEVDVNAMVRETADGCRIGAEAATGARIELRLELDPSVPHIHVQPGRVRQGFDNLIANAFQAAAAAPNPYVRVSTLHLPVNEKRPVIVCIANPSEPITREAMEQWFEPFFTTRAQGTGLGVPIAFQAVLANGGVLEVEYEEGEVRCWVRLPLRVRPGAQRSSRTVPKLTSTAREK
ncbi:MAG: histidine kinase dimerization/phospho-acceptor domain-containing protein [Candidatus Sumerlaeia bacterium]|nr:histidine kinase dimerization/phospho-acceptor domain-containing protein [Candidatus Sumerlaeia bacterium]